LSTQSRKSIKSSAPLDQSIRIKFAAFFGAEALRDPLALPIRLLVAARGEKVQSGDREDLAENQSNLSRARPKRPTTRWPTEMTGTLDV